MGKLAALSILLILIMIHFTAYSAARTFVGSGNITIIEPSMTRLAICTPNEKYSFERGTNYSVRLYVRNDMDNKTVKRVYVSPESDPRIGFVLNPDHLEDIMPNEYKYFDIDVIIPEDIPYGNYRVEFQAGTDEHMEGSFMDEMLIRVRPFSDSMQYLIMVVSVVIVTAFIYRFFWMRSVNRKHRRKSLKLRP